MTTYEQFRSDLRDALNHLHRPDHRPSSLARQVVTGDADSDLPTVQTAILDAIAALTPPADTPDSARMMRLHSVLDLRFVQALIQEETAERLHLSMRSVRREERIATHVLARYLWEHHVGRVEESRDGGSSGAVSAVAEGDAPVTWQARMREELEALWSGHPDAVAELGPVVDRVVALERALAARYGKTLTVDPISERLTVEMPPAALRTLLIMAIGQLCRHARPGVISISVAHSRARATLSLAAPGGESLPEIGQLSEMVELLGGDLRAEVGSTAIRVDLTLPGIGPITVAVVDDNRDFVHFCQRCVRGTPYTVVTPSATTLDAIKALEPDVILLDLLLPETDGWELLDALREDASTQHLPIAVCSVVPEADLALLLGAAVYLPKPIDHRDLIATLDHLTDQGQVSPS